MKNIQDQEPFSDIKKIQFGNLFDLIISMKFTVILITVFITSVALITNSMKTPLYRAETTIISSGNSNVLILGEIISNFIPILELSDVELPNMLKANQTVAGIEILKSRDFFNRFSKQHDVIETLLAAKSWNQKTQSIEFNPKIYNQDTKTFYVLDSKSSDANPISFTAAHNKFLTSLKIKYEPKYESINISFDHISPYVAMDWLNDIISLMNEYAIEAEIEDANKLISFLEARVDSIQLIDLKRSFNELIKYEKQKIIGIKSSNSNLFEVLDPASLPQQTIQNSIWKIGLQYLIVGFFLSIIAILILNKFSKSPAKLVK